MNRRNQKSLKKDITTLPFQNAFRLLEGRRKVVDGFESKIFPKGHLGILASAAKVSDRSRLKILTPKQMLQRLPIAPTQVRTGNTSENVLNEIRQIYINCIEQKK